MATIRPNQATGGDGATLIGESVRIRGTLSGDEDLHVLGRVDGRIELQRTLVVAPSGIVKAEVTVKNAVISGIVVGNVHATESIEITKGGRMVGDVFAPRVIIVDGASFRGNVDMGDIENMPARRPSSGERPRFVPPPSRTTAAPAPIAKGKSVVPVRPTTTPPQPAVTKAPERPVERPEEKATPSQVPAANKPTPLEPPMAKGLPQKANKTRVIVKRK